MSGFLTLIGVVMMVIGALVALVAKSAFHEILSATGIGLGAVVLALGIVAARLADILDHLRKRFPLSPEEIKETAPPQRPAERQDTPVSWKSRGVR